MTKCKQGGETVYVYPYILEYPYDDILDTQRWIREDNADKSIFALINPLTKLYLTTIDATSLNVQPAINWTFPVGGVPGVIRNEDMQKVLEVNAEGKTKIQKNINPQVHCYC